MNALKTDEWDRIIDVNIKGVLNGIAAVLPIMEAQGRGHIINTASTGAHAVGAQFGVCCASKCGKSIDGPAAQRLMVEILASEAQSNLVACAEVMQSITP